MLTLRSLLITLICFSVQVCTCTGVCLCTCVYGCILFLVTYRMHVNVCMRPFCFVADYQTIYPKKTVHLEIGEQLQWRSYLNRHKYRPTALSIFGEKIVKIENGIQSIVVNGSGVTVSPTFRLEIDRVGASDNGLIFCFQRVVSYVIFVDIQGSCIVLNVTAYVPPFSLTGIRPTATPRPSNSITSTRQMEEENSSTTAATGIKTATQRQSNTSPAPNLSQTTSASAPPGLSSESRADISNFDNIFETNPENPCRVYRAYTNSRASGNKQKLQRTGVAH